MSTKDHQRAPQHRRERLHLQTPRGYTCTLPGTTRADSGGSKNETKKLTLLFNIKKVKKL